VCEHVAELRAALGRYVGHFDPALLTTTDVHAVVSEAARPSSMAQTLLAMAANRAADDASWRQGGYHSAAEALARQVGVSTGLAKEVLALGARLSNLPALRQAAGQGSLSAQQTAMVAEAAEAAPKAQDRLVDLAHTASYGELKHACQQTLAAADSDPEGRRRKIKRHRSLRSWTDVGGTWHLSAKGNPEQGAQLLSALHPFKEAAFRQARSEGRREAEDAYRFDALMAMAEEALAQGDKPKAADSPTGDTGGSANDDASNKPRRTGAPAKVIVRIDYEALMRGVTHDGETAEIAGLGPVPVLAVRELIESGNAFLAAVVTRAERVVGVTHFGRRPGAYQKTALQWSHPSCAVEGCFRQARLEADHLVPWARSRHTTLDELDHKCEFHHDLKSRKGWDYVEGTHVFVPPGDPRHPCHRPAARHGAGP
jgi:Domain of unknown function (DUF222)